MHGIATVDRGARYCPNCWQSFAVGDWRLGARGVCFGCRAVLISPEQRQAGFEAAMRLVDTPTLQRWAATATSGNRRVTAAKVLRERENRHGEETDRTRRTHA